MFAAIIDFIEWHWWLIAALAFVYGVAVMALVFAMLAKSIKADGEVKDLQDMSFPGNRANGEQP